MMSDDPEQTTIPPPTDNGESNETEPEEHEASHEHHYEQIVEPVLNRAQRRALVRFVWRQMKLGERQTRRRTQRLRGLFVCGACSLSFIGPASARCQCKAAMKRKQS